jgi:hypothetical protein
MGIYCRAISADVNLYRTPPTKVVVSIICGYALIANKGYGSGWGHFLCDQQALNLSPPGNVNDIETKAQTFWYQNLLSE